MKSKSKMRTLADITEIEEKAQAIIKKCADAREAIIDDDLKVVGVKDSNCRFHQKIVLEVGHGDHPKGFEPGAVDERTGAREWDLNKVCANACFKKLKDLGFDNVVVTDSGNYLTRIGEEFKDADVFISVHHNAFTDQRAQGSEALVHSTLWQPQDDKLARLIAKANAAALGIPNRGIKLMKLGVLSGAMNIKKPAQAVCLIEPYFITGEDVDNHEEWSVKAGNATAQAIKDFCQGS